MKKRLLLLISCMVIMLLCGCEELESDGNVSNNVGRSSHVVVENNVAYFGYDGCLYSADLDDDGFLKERQVVADFGDDISSMLIYEDKLFFSTDKGIMNISLSSLNTDKNFNSANIITEKESENYNFYVYNGCMYIENVGKVEKVDIATKEETTVINDVEMFAVAPDGIFGIDKSGQLCNYSFDGEKLNEIGSFSKDAIVDYVGGKIIVSDAGESALIDPGDCSVTALKIKNANEVLRPLVMFDGKVYYQDEQYKSLSYDINTRDNNYVEFTNNSEDLLTLPDFVYCYCIDKNTCYSLFYDKLTQINLSTKSAGILNLSPKKDETEKQQTKSKSDNKPKETEKKSSDYNIADGLNLASSEGNVRIVTSHFELYMPTSVEWDYTVANNNCITIFYPPAKAEGVGGEVVSIIAYDWGSDEYGDLPNYKIAGLTADKIYVALFPTDVRFTDKTEAGYKKLLKFVERIDNSEENAADNPFIPLDE